MISVEQQVHGYRQGHQLLSSSVSLDKVDQSALDQLSDVAGPLRPGELFEPYLSAYPLPSGAYYVLARTWQDLKVVRAGCVRTLSLLVRMDDWTSAEAILPFLGLLEASQLPVSASTQEIAVALCDALPPVDDFEGKELLEALFLEESKPIVVFDPPAPELVAVRLMTALWPGIRKRFTLSTFALSPRKIDGKFFDLVFAPKDAKPRFSDWPGRRIDGRADRDSRHRWTSFISKRVFVEPHPKLMGTADWSLEDTSEDESFAALRIALLWGELFEKLERSPTAALGLLDIAISRMPGGSGSAVTLAPLLSDATVQAINEFPPTDAWDFLGALVRKMQGVYPDSYIQAVALPVTGLAAQDPAGALELLSRPDPNDALANLIPLIAKGLAQAFDRAESPLAAAVPRVLIRLVSKAEALAKRVASSQPLLASLTEAVPVLDLQDLWQLRSALLPLLFDDSQAGLAEKFFGTLDANELLAEVQHLGEFSAFSAPLFFRPISARARQLNAVVDLRHALLRFNQSEARDQFVFATLSPSSEDVLWLISDPALTAEAANVHLLRILRSASHAERLTLLQDARILSRIPDGDVDLLLWAVRSVDMHLDLYLEIVSRLLPLCQQSERGLVALDALEKCLGSRFQGDEQATLATLFEAASNMLDTRLVCRAGLSRDVAPEVLSRNLVAINSTSESVRGRFVEDFDQLAEVLASRYALELSADGADSCASLLWAAQSNDGRAGVIASGYLLPQLFHSVRAPVSLIVAAAFPAVYKELASRDEVPDLLKFVPFMDWDKCKAARRQLVDAFMHSQVWAPKDLALTAYLCMDLDRILGRVRRAYGGAQYLHRMIEQSAQLPASCREAVQAAAARLTTHRQD